MTSEARWALSASAVRRARAELQQLRTEREQVKAGLASEWARQSVDEFGQALRWLDEYSADKPDGLGRPGGLCPGCRLDDGAIVKYAVGTFVSARAKGLSADASIGAMHDAILKSEEYRIAHPTRAGGK